MKATIKGELREIETNHKIKILLAVESGSRAWGIESKDSDFDIRFIFSRKKGDYLTLDRKPEVIEVKKENRDYVGFDIFKFLQHLKVSNPSAIEWIKSDIVYIKKMKGFKKLNEYINGNVNPIALFHHYKSLCKNNYIKFLRDGDDVRYKRYLYCLRGMLNAEFVLETRKIPPIKFSELLPFDTPRFFLSKVLEIIRVKKEGFEKDNIEKIPVLDNEIESFLKSTDEPESKKVHSIGFLNDILKMNLEE